MYSQRSLAAKGSLRYGTLNLFTISVLLFHNSVPTPSRDKFFYALLLGFGSVFLAVFPLFSLVLFQGSTPLDVLVVVVVFDVASLPAVRKERLARSKGKYSFPMEKGVDRRR